MFRLVLLDAEGNYIESPGIFFGDEIQVYQSMSFVNILVFQVSVTYPTVFHDTDQNGVRSVFKLWQHL